MLIAGIDAMPEEFDSHELILKVAHDNQGDYVQHLQSVNPSSIPFQIVHSRLGTDIARTCRDRNYKETPSRSKDIFGHMGSCVIWKKT
jgi:hypothetical protein